MEVLKLGVQSELQTQAYTTATAKRDPSASATYTAAHGNTGSLTHQGRPGIKPATSRFLVRFISTAPQWELQNAEILETANTWLSSTQKWQQCLTANKGRKTTKYSCVLIMRAGGKKAQKGKEKEWS